MFLETGLARMQRFYAFGNEAEEVGAEVEAQPVEGGAELLQDG